MVRISIVLRTMLLVALALAVAACGPSVGGSGGETEDYPSEDIRLIVQAEAGGTSDLTARTAAGIAEKKLGTNIVVENRPGAAGSIAMKQVASAQPDGYTLGYLPVEVSMLQYLGYDVKPSDYAMIAQGVQVPATLTVRADSPYETMEDFVRAAKEQPNQMSVGNSGPGSIWHAATGAVEQEAGVELEPVPFDGGAPAAAALIAGDLDAVTVGVGEVLPGVEAGDLRTLAVLDEKPAPQLPEVPTAKEAGYEVEVLAWGGFGAPADTPEAVIDELNKAFREAVESEDYTQALAETGNQAAYKGPEEFASYARSQAEVFGRIIPDLEISQQ